MSIPHLSPQTLLGLLLTRVCNYLEASWNSFEVFSEEMRDSSRHGACDVSASCGLNLYMLVWSLLWMTGLMGCAFSNFQEGLIVVSHKTSFTSKV